MTTQNKCCERCRGPLVFTPEPNIVGCMDTGCPCHTQKKSIRDMFRDEVSAIVHQDKYEQEVGAGRLHHDILAAFDTALEAIAVQVQENIRKPKHQECSNGNHEPCDVCVATDVWNRSQDLSATIIRSHKKEI